VRVVTIRLAQPSISLYSLLHSDLCFLPKSQKAYQTTVAARREKYPMLVRDLEESKAGFMLHKVPVTTFINDDLLANGDSTMVQLVLGPTVLDEGDFIDIPLETVLKHTNTRNIKHACALIECAAAMGALRVFVAFNPFWGRKGSSAYRGIPLIDTGVFFSALDKSFLQDVRREGSVTASIATTASITAATGCEYDSLNVDLSIAVKPEAVVKCDGVSDCVTVPTPDFAIVGPGFLVDKAYRFAVNLTGGVGGGGVDGGGADGGDSTDGDSVGQTVPGVFVGYFNVSSVSSSGSGSWGGSSKFKRRKLQAMA
jgi:hypothetical protein